MEAREKHKENLGKISKQDKMLNGILHMGEEAHATAQDVAVKMDGQTRMIMNAIDYTKEANRNVGQSKDLLNMISRKEFIYKLLLYALAITLFCVIIGIMLHKVK